MQPLDSSADHPLGFIKSLRGRYGAHLELGFSHYRYQRRSRADVRRSFRVPIADVNVAWLRCQLDRLSPGEELALESRVRVGRSTRHIPMIDFVGIGPDHLRAVMDVLPGYSVRDVFVYRSGRSFHAYYPMLITQHEWVRFMGSALLCNTPSHPRIVDQRWVGHRLIAGYASLRWSWNTPTYKALPARVHGSSKV
jgi:hypothetical protein